MNCANPSREPTPPEGVPFRALPSTNLFTAAFGEIELFRENGLAVCTELWHGRLPRWILTIRPTGVRRPNFLRVSETELLRDCIGTALEVAHRLKLRVLYTDPLPPSAWAPFLRAGFLPSEELVMFERRVPSFLGERKLRKDSLGSRAAAPRAVVVGQPEGEDGRRWLSLWLSPIAAIDEAAFDDFWNLAQEGLLKAAYATQWSRFFCAISAASDKEKPGHLQRFFHTSLNASLGEVQGCSAAGSQSTVVAGYALVGAEGKTGYLQRLAVHPAFARRGIGTQLVVESIASCRQKGVRRIWVNTAARNKPAIRLYRSLGFKPLPERWRILKWNGDP
jgi:ribosomal protein S18 acetylase RimI-like enzyme